MTTLPALPDSPLPCPVCGSYTFEEFNLSDFVHEGYYYTDTSLEITYDRVVHKLKHLAGPAFANSRGRRVWFDGLDWGIQSGMITALTRGINDKEEYVRNMPRGKWSDYEDQGGTRRGGRESEAERMINKGAMRRQVASHKVVLGRPWMQQ